MKAYINTNNHNGMVSVEIFANDLLLSWREVCSSGSNCGIEVSMIKGVTKKAISKCAKKNNTQRTYINTITINTILYTPAIGQYNMHNCILIHNKSQRFISPHHQSIFSRCSIT